jgi:hypothetical protein
LEKITKEITEYLKHLSGTSREEETTVASGKSNLKMPRRKRGS